MDRKKFIMATLLQVRNGRNHLQRMMLLNQLQRRAEEENFEFIFLVINILWNVEHIRPNCYYNDWIPFYLDYDFFSLYRMNKTTFFQLLRELHLEEKNNKGGGEPVCVEKQLLMTLWWLGKSEVLLSIADRFGVSLATVYNSTTYVLKKMVDARSRYIKWPAMNEVHILETEFRARCGYPGVIGAIDVCNIEIKAPRDQQASYIDRYLNHSIKLQAVCSPNKILTNIMVGFPGSAHDSRVLRNSQLFLEVEHNNNYRNYFFNNSFHLVGDSAYPLFEWLMKPYRDNGHLTNIQRHHNTCLSITRVVIEHTFGLLKSRWRILQFINVNTIPKAIQIITACCMLHNFCYMNADFWNEYEPVRNNNAEDEPGGNLVAGQKRDTIAEELFQRRNV